MVIIRTGQAVIDAINSKLSREFGSEKVKFSLKEDTNIGPEHAGKYYVVVQSSEHSINFTSDNINDGGADAFGFIVGDTPENIAGLAEKHTNVYKESTKMS